MFGEVRGVVVGGEGEGVVEGGRELEESWRGRRTPLFQVSQSLVTPTSKPTPNAKAPTKIVLT